MLSIPWGRYEKGTWRRVQRDGETIYVFTCPNCGGSGGLDGKEGNHTVNSDGIVSPSVVCDCGFHDYIRLLGIETG